MVDKRISKFVDWMLHSLKAHSEPYFIVLRKHSERLLAYDTGLYAKLLIVVWSEK